MFGVSVPTKNKYLLQFKLTKQNSCRKSKHTDSQVGFSSNYSQPWPLLLIHHGYGPISCRAPIARLTSLHTSSIWYMQVGQPNFQINHPQDHCKMQKASQFILITKHNHFGSDHRATPSSLIFVEIPWDLVEIHLYQEVQGHFYSCKKLLEEIMAPQLPTYRATRLLTPMLIPLVQFMWKLPKNPAAEIQPTPYC